MQLNRRQFLKGAAVTGAATAAMPAEAALFVRDAKEMPPKAIGILYDSALCIGCRACVTACKETNGMPVESPVHLSGWNEGTWDTAQDLSGKTLNVIKAYRDGAMAQKDREENGYAFIKRHCLHCVDPSCVSVCPVGAMKKDAETGVVTHDPDACIGCRYCVYGCPFGVPQFDLSNAFGQIQKCQMCTHLLKKGGFPACCDVCPTGASLFGTVEDLQQEADRRLAQTPGAPYNFPRGRLGDNRPRHEAPIPRYIKDVYGVDDGGGTQVRYLASIPFVKLGLPDLPKTAYAAVSEGVQHALYKYLIAPAVLFLGFAFFAHRNTRKNEDEEA